MLQQVIGGIGKGMWLLRIEIKGDNGRGGVG